MNRNMCSHCLILLKFGVVSIFEMLSIDVESYVALLKNATNLEKKLSQEREQVAVVN